MTAPADCRVAFAEALVALAADDPRIVALTNDSIGSSNLERFRKRFPDRVVNVGITSAAWAALGRIR